MSLLSFNLCDKWKQSHAILVWKCICVVIILEHIQILPLLNGEATYFYKTYCKLGEQSEILSFILSGRLSAVTESLLTRQFNTWMEMSIERNGQTLK